MRRLGWGIARLVTRIIECYRKSYLFSRHDTRRRVYPTSMRSRCARMNFIVHLWRRFRGKHPNVYEVDDGERERQTGESIAREWACLGVSCGTDGATSSGRGTLRSPGTLLTFPCLRETDEAGSRRGKKQTFV